MIPIVVTEHVGEFEVYKDGSVFHFDKYGRKHRCTAFVGQRGYLNYYVRCGKQRKHVYLHTLLALAYKSNPYGYTQVRHLDGNKLNNKLNNLKWGTQAQNNEDKRRHGTDNSGERCGTGKLKEVEVRQVWSLLQEGDATQSEIARTYGVARSTINDILHNRTWRCLCLGY